MPHAMPPLLAMSEIGLAGLGVAALGGCVFALLAWGRLHGSTRDLISPRTSLLRVKHAMVSEEGTATMEFALVLPVVLFLMLLLAQVTLVLAANTVVNYAAFAATRTAIVQIPADYGSQSGEDANALLNSDRFPKLGAIRDAACFAVMPVSGRLDPGSVDATPLVDGLDQFYADYGRDSPGWVGNLAGGRLQYAFTHTQVDLLRANAEGERVEFERLPGGSVQFFEPREAVTVLVTHKLNLAIPWVRPIFADGEFDTADGPGGYAEITARATLTNEGIDPHLPPEPELKRRP